MTKNKKKLAKIYALEKNLKTLKKIKCPPNMKKELRKAARAWIRYIRQHILDLHSDGFFEEYHRGEISSFELFFDIDKVKWIRKNKK